VDKVVGILVGVGAEELDLVENESAAFVLVFYLVEFIDDVKKIGFFVACVGEKLFSREGKVVLGGDDEDDDINFLLASEKGGCVKTVAIEARGVDERDIDETVIKERLVRGTGVIEINLDKFVGVVVVSDDMFKLSKGSL